MEVQEFAVGLKSFIRMRRTCPQIIRKMIYCAIQLAQHRFGCPDASKRQPLLPLKEKCI